MHGHSSRAYTCTQNDTLSLVDVRNKAYNKNPNNNNNNNNTVPCTLGSSLSLTKLMECNKSVRIG